MGRIADRCGKLVEPGRLLSLLDSQTLVHGAFEVIVIDDGSAEPVGPMLYQLRTCYPLQHVRIDWSGQAVARHRGACLATGDILVFVDDDMQVPPDFLAAHVARHAAQPRAVVLGHLKTAPGIGEMPLFERFNARQLERWRADVLAGRVRPRGQHLCTGNVSMTRADLSFRDLDCNEIIDETSCSELPTR